MSLTTRFRWFLAPLRNSALVWAACAALGCATHPVTRGADLYAAGRFVDAAEVFEHSEARVRASDLDERARYGLYRGATFLSLGDYSAAERWLSYAARLQHEDQGALTDDETRMLRRALAVTDLQTARQRSAAQQTATADGLRAQVAP